MGAPWDVIGERALAHLALSAGALAVALAIGLVLAALVRARPRTAGALRSLSATFVVVPAIGLLAGLATVWPAAFGPAALAFTVASLVAVGTVVPVLLLPAAAALRAVAAVRRGLAFAIGAVALAAFTGGPGLGRFLVEGITQADPQRLIVGGLALAALAVSLDVVLGVIGRRAFSQRSASAA